MDQMCQYNFKVILFTNTNDDDDDDNDDDNNIIIIIIIIIIIKYHSRLAQLIAIKKGEQCAKTISWIRTRTSFALLRSALVCLRGSRTRRVPCDIKNVDIDVEVAEGAIKSDY